MPSNPVAENVLGTIGTVCWTAQLIPQVWMSWREKSTDGLSHWLMFIWACAAPFLGIFVILQDLNVPLIVQPQLFGLLAALSWAQCMYYGQKKSLEVSIAMFIAFVILLGGFEAGMIFATKHSYESGNHRPVQFFGICSSILIAAGLLPQYVEIWRQGEVKGISMIFMTVDLAGGIFSDLSLVFRPKFDIIASLTYSLVVVLDGVVILLAIILNPRAKRKRALIAASQHGASDVTQIIQPPALNIENHSGIARLPRARRDGEKPGDYSPAGSTLYPSSLASHHEDAENKS